MLRIVIGFMLLVVMLTFASAAFPSDASQGVPPLQCNKTADLLAPHKAVADATTNCGPYTCADNGSCCGDNTCCPSGYNIYCKNSSRCYNTTAGAEQDCGMDYQICYTPAN